MGLFRFSDTQLSKLAGRCSSRVRAIGASNREDVTLLPQLSASSLDQGSNGSRDRSSRSSSSTRSGGSRRSSQSSGSSSNRSSNSSNSHTSLDGGRFQIRVCDAWLDLDEADNSRLLEAVSAGLSGIQIDQRAQPYEYNNLQTLQGMHQTNLLTGRQRPVRFVPHAGRPAVAPMFVLDKKGRPSVNPKSNFLKETSCAGDRPAKAPKSMPYWLEIELPNTPVVSGLYHMAVGERRNNLPIWRFSDPNCECESWLFSTEDNHWVIVANSEVVAFSPEHQGRSPHEILGNWQRTRAPESVDHGIKVDEVEEPSLLSTDDEDLVSEYSEGTSPSQFA